jgi:hypothetical protein
MRVKVANRIGAYSQDNPHVTASAQPPDTPRGMVPILNRYMNIMQLGLLRSRLHQHGCHPILKAAFG